MRKNFTVLVLPVLSIIVYTQQTKYLFIPFLIRMSFMVMPLSMMGRTLPYMERVSMGSSNLFMSGLASSEKIFRMVLPYFKTSSSLYFLGYASKELCFDVNLETESSLSSKINQCRETTLPDTQSLAAIRDFSIAHGVLFIGTGVCTALEALHEFSLINLGNAHSPIAWTGTGLFLFANMVSLQQNLAIFKQASEMSLATEQDKQQAETMLRSAILGMISNLGYITATSIAILGAPTAIAVIIGCISAFFGSLKILHDFYCLYLQKNGSRQELAAIDCSPVVHKTQHAS